MRNTPLTPGNLSPETSSSEQQYLFIHLLLGLENRISPTGPLPMVLKTALTVLNQSDFIPRFNRPGQKNQFGKNPDWFEVISKLEHESGKRFAFHPIEGEGEDLLAGIDNHLADNFPVLVQLQEGSAQPAFWVLIIGAELRWQNGETFTTSFMGLDLDLEMSCRLSTWNFQLDFTDFLTTGEVWAYPLNQVVQVNHAVALECP